MDDSFFADMPVTPTVVALRVQHDGTHVSQRGMGFQPFTSPAQTLQKIGMPRVAPWNTIANVPPPRASWNFKGMLRQPGRLPHFSPPSDTWTCFSKGRGQLFPMPPSFITLRALRGENYSNKLANSPRCPHPDKGETT